MKLFDAVTLCTNKYKNYGAENGDVGCIVEEYGDGYFEVEFYYANSGETYALFAAHESELEIVDGPPCKNMKNDKNYNPSDYFTED